MKLLKEWTVPLINGKICHNSQKLLSDVSINKMKTTLKLDNKQFRRNNIVNSIIYCIYFVLTKAGLNLIINTVIFWNITI